jgi:threonine dehydratase
VTEVVGVEARASSPFTQSLAAGRIVAVTVGPTLADGLAGNLDLDTITFDIVARLVSRIVLVSEGELRSAIAGIAAHERLIVEGAGGAGVAPPGGHLDDCAFRTSRLFSRAPTSTRHAHG